ncbi:MAG: SUMF1/EgtB/PvdO family nonheme iron enzyme [Chloroflexota bacterium]
MRRMNIFLLIGVAALALLAVAPFQADTPLPPTPTATPEPPKIIQEIEAWQRWLSARLPDGWVWVVLIIGLAFGGLWWLLRNAPDLLEKWDRLRERFFERPLSDEGFDLGPPPFYESEFVGLELSMGAADPELRPVIGLNVRSPGEDPNMPPGFREIRRFHSLEEAMQDKEAVTGQPYPAFALLGIPGSGKTTLLEHLYRQVERDYRHDPTNPQPLRVSLSAYRGEGPMTFLRRRWQEKWKDDGDLDLALQDGRLWLFADGLNEMPRYQERMSHWRSFARNYIRSGNRALFACRSDDYGEGLDLPRLVIHEMDEKRIQDFLHKRIPGQAANIWQELEKDRRQGRGDLYRLAQTPFWLDKMVLVSSGGLPPNRAKLLEKFVDCWLGEPRHAQRDLSTKERAACLEGLTRLGWYGLQRSQNYTFSYRRARRILGWPSNQAPVLERAVTGLLKIEKPEDAAHTTRFFHQIFQEYFAAIELADRFRSHRLWPRQARFWHIPWRKWEFVYSRWDPLPSPPSTDWEEASVIAAGMLPAEQVDRFVRVVLRYNPPLAARCALESDVRLAVSTVDLVRKRLLALMNTPRTRLSLRIAAAKALARLDDPRLTPLSITGRGAGVDVIAPDFIPIPAGPFRMGTNARNEEKLKTSGVDEQWITDDEKTGDQDLIVTISYDYQIGKYPLTNAEFRAFVDADGYGKVEGEKPPWWSETGWRWRIGLWDTQDFSKYSEASREFVRNWLARRSKDKRGQPFWWDDPQWNVANLPVVGVSWFEAEAYCNWLTIRLREAGTLPDNLVMRLPTEAEWEKAARGAAGGLWPWGDKWEAAKCNNAETEDALRRTSPVGIYPHGASPCGALDMVGNVWEWCLDRYEADEYQRLLGLPQPVTDPRGPATGDRQVLRGGSWDCDRHFARCAYRLRYIPDDFDCFVGFRLVRAPG